MKRNIISLKISSIILACTLSTALFAQSEETLLKKIYTHVGGGTSSNNGSAGEFGIQAIWRKNWSTTFSYQDISMDVKNLPSNYEPGYTIFLVLPISDSYPTTNARFYNFSAGKSFPAGRKVWFTTEAGLSFVNGEKYTFTPQEVQTEWFIFGYTTSNYATQTESATSVGATLRADANWAFASFAGLGFGAYANINSLQSVVGFNIKLTMGWMNRKHI
jgi:hypothetical protein